MAKKKSGEQLKLGAVKLERDIISKAKMIAADHGTPLAGYLSDSLRPWSNGTGRRWSRR